MTFVRGMQLGRYQIIAPLGKGGMGEVYRAKDTQLGREVAIKVLPEHLAEDAISLKRFEREARAVAALSHPNILSIHDSGTDRGVTYAVMELLEGETLRARLGGSAIPWRKALEIYDSGVHLRYGWRAERCHRSDRISAFDSFRFKCRVAPHRSTLGSAPQQSPFPETGASQIVNFSQS